MKPTKIYIGAKQAAELDKNSEGRHTMTVKTFPSKNDVEYINVAALWHDREIKPVIPDSDGVVWIIAQKEGFRFEEFCIPDDSEDEDWQEIVSENEIVRWLYIFDLEPKLGWGDE